MDELEEKLHVERVKHGGFGPWLLLDRDDSVRVYNILPDQAVLAGETTIKEIECLTSQDQDSSPSE